MISYTATRPVFLSALLGTTEVVPCYKASHCGFVRHCVWPAILFLKQRIYGLNPVPFNPLRNHLAADVGFNLATVCSMCPQNVTQFSSFS